LRIANDLASREGIGAVFLCGSGEGPAVIRRPLPAGVRNLSQADVLARLSPGAPVLVVSAGGLPAAQGVDRFLEASAGSGTAAAWTRKGLPVGRYEPDARRLAGSGPLLGAAPPTAGLRVEAREGDWTPLGNADEVARAEDRLVAGLSHGHDGFISRFDRSISIPISRRLARTAVTPNQVTAVSIVVGLAGAALLASPSRGLCVAGALLAWFSSILDGCDGELARLKLLSSEAGRRFDLFGDYLVNVAVLGGVVWHVHATRPDVPLLLLGLLLASGWALSGASAWWFFLRRPGQVPEGLMRTFQRLASRDFIYLILALAIAGRLEWFLYAAAVGAHLFWIGLSLTAAVAGRSATADRRPS
jgi:phosphatidylglycerophosphate synthase